MERCLFSRKTRSYRKRQLRASEAAHATRRGRSTQALRLPSFGVGPSESSEKRRIGVSYRSPLSRRPPLSRGRAVTVSGEVLRCSARAGHPDDPDRHRRAASSIAQTGLSVPSRAAANVYQVKEGKGLPGFANK